MTGIGIHSQVRERPLTHSIRQRKGLAPAVLADLALGHLAGVRQLKQRAQSAASHLPQPERFAFGSRLGL
jgi:hypothetical protein